jgi:hypothetical protein
MIESKNRVHHRVEYGLLSFGGCCEDNHRTCQSAAELRNEHVTLLDKHDSFANTREYILTTSSTFRIQGILLWEPSFGCIIDDIEIGHCSQIMSPGGIPATAFLSPFEFSEIVELCKGGQLTYALQSKNVLPITMPTLTPKTTLSLTMRGDVYDLIFWGVRLLPEQTSD